MKKILAVLLSLVMVLSLGVAAFAEDPDPSENEDVNWVAIPLSPAGLQNGDYYLDFNGNEYSSVYSSYDWFIDFDNFAVKASKMIPASEYYENEDDIPEGVTEVETFMDDGDSSDVISENLRQVGANWVEVKFSDGTQGLANGDYYFDVNLFFDEEDLASMSDEEIAEAKAEAIAIYSSEFPMLVNTEDSSLFKFNLGDLYYPLAYLFGFISEEEYEEDYLFFYEMIQQYTADDPTDPGNEDPTDPGNDDPTDPGNDDPTEPAPENPDNGETDGKKNFFADLWAKLVAFFQKIFDFIKGLLFQ